MPGRLFPAFLLLFVLLAAPAAAQPEIPRMRASLEGIPAFQLAVVVEAGIGLKRHAELDVEQIHARTAARLELAGIELLRSDAASREEVPYLHVHINALDAGDGLIPFAVEASFYQGVRLVHAPSRTTVANTWDTEVVGIVSPDQMHLIPESVDALVDEFIDDYLLANPVRRRRGD